jgi:alpha-beta hydrolase superfamily lysophospholipase
VGTGGVDPRSELGLAFEEVAFPAAGGSTLRGWFVPGRPRAHAGVVAVHGAGGDRRNYLDRLPAFHEAGYPVLLYDSRDHGTSDGAGRGLGLGFRELHDVSSAVAYMKREHGYRAVAVVGTSMGGVSALLAAAGDPAIDVVVAENAWARLLDVMRAGALRRGFTPTFARPLIHDLAIWRLDATGEPEPIDVVGRIAPRPVLVAAGTADPLVPYRQSEELFEKAGEPREVWLVEGAGHDRLYLHDPAGYRRRVIGFLQRGLGQILPPPAAPTERVTPAAAEAASQ